MKDCKKIQTLLPALITNKKQAKMTEDCKKSLVSFEHCVKVDLDTKKYEARVAGVWNNFLDKWRGKDYDYLLITANDTQADPMAIDFMVQFMEEKPNTGIVTGKVDRDLEAFKRDFGQREYTSISTKGLIDPACFLIRKGVIEKVGRIDEQFPGPFVERDFMYRVRLAGFVIDQPEVVLWYHPPYAGTIGNDQYELHTALKKYLLKWGGDANAETFTFPYNDLNLDYTYCLK